MVMTGLTLSSLKKNPALIPLFFCLGVGVTASILYTLRLATRNPDVSWNKKKTPEPWQEWADKRYQFMSYSGKEVKSQAPKY